MIKELPSLESLATKAGESRISKETRALIILFSCCRRMTESDSEPVKMYAILGWQVEANSVHLAILVAIISTVFFILWDGWQRRKRMLPHVVFYHQPCPDGLACRMVIEDFFGELASQIDFRPWIHGKVMLLENLQGKRVWFLDATPSTESLLDKKQLGECSLVLILDHHNNETVAATFQASRSMKHVAMFLEKGDRCGAVLVFRYLRRKGRRPIPYWLDSINKGDTNLIRSRQPHEKAYHAWITRAEVMVDVPSFRAAIQEDIRTAITKGQALLSKRAEECEKAWAGIE